MWRDQAFFLDMLLAAEDALRFAQGLDQAGFLRSELHQSAILRKLEIVGEAAGLVSREYQESHPEIPWAGMISMRNRLIHGYRVVDLEIVWRVVQQELSPLMERLRPLIPSESET